ncbi:hypothetical protein QOZ80_5AG0404620 [Eleusine coracana subsp. coracana]|nr:hypothetical protein QOZ80_5AG0404620 [Eleusine coracana subsp. coracana]
MGDNIINVSFNISSEDVQQFRQFIVNWRSMLRAADRPAVMLDALRLPTQEDVPTRWMDLELRTANNAITLRMRADNLFIIGFRNAAGRWFEFTHNNNRGPMIPGSTTIRVHEGYTGNRNTLQLDEGVQIRCDFIVEAIDNLANYDGDTTASDNQLRNWLLRLVVVFAESIRNNTVLDHVARELPIPGIETMTQFPWELIGLIKDWSSLCTLLLQVINDVVQDPDVMVQRFSPYHQYDIHNAFQLASMLGMVLIKNPNRQHGRRPRRSVDDNLDGAVAGITLLEVVEVIVLDIDGEKPGDLYGMITVTDGFGLQIIFEREWSNIQSVYPDEQAKLTGPNRAMSGDDGFAVNFNLMDRDLDLSPDDEVSNGEVVWNPLDATSDDYDKLHSTVVTGASGKVELRYAIMTDAAVATVEVVLLQSSESVPNVYGTVTTTVNLDDDDGTAVTVKLLNRDNTESVDVERGSAIPLMRNVVAVPLCSEVQVSLDLWDRNLIFADEHLANGAATFQPLFAGGGESQEVDNGRVKVRVTWSTWFEL